MLFRQLLTGRAAIAVSSAWLVLGSQAQALTTSIAQGKTTTSSSISGPAGYTWCASENDSFTLPSTCDVAYGANGSFNYQYGKIGAIKFNNATFGDPLFGTVKAGFYKLSTVINTNLALGKTTTTSSTETAALTSANAVDGSAATRWSSAFSDPQWIAVDLGQTCAINRVVLRWEAAYGKAYQIQVSNDAINWTTIYTTTAGGGGVNDLTGLSGNGRYVRMFGTARTTINGAQYGYSLYEFEVYGATDGNHSPAVSITSPIANAVFTAPATIKIDATAADSDGTIAKVEFYQGSTLLGSATSSPYSFTWNNVADGSYTLTAKATDDKGASTTSAPVTISVGTPVVVKPATSDTPFTIAAIPDSQFMVSSQQGGTPAMFERQIQWVADKVHDPNLNVVFVSQLGDITDNGSLQWQFDNAKNAMFKLDNLVPYAIAPGNHDCMVRGNLDYSLLDQNFLTSKYASQSWFGGTYQANHYENNFELFNVDGMEFVIIHMAYNPSAAVRAWASSVLNQYPNRRGIIATHEYLPVNGGPTAVGTSIWNDVVKSHANVFLVLCGHNHGENTIITKNDAGNTVYQFLTDYQNDNPQTGRLRTYTFKPGQNSIIANTYATETGLSSTNFTVSYQMK